MENFLTIAPPTSKDGAALFAPLSRPECEALLALPPEYQGSAAAFAKSLAPRIMASLPTKLCGVFV